MSGHSKWHSIRHKKAKEDARRGKIFTKLIRELIVAARMGGGDPENNARLRTAISTARAANMPADNIERAIKKGTGEDSDTHYEEYSYEGYGPNGVAVYVEVLTDNKNRTTAEIRHLFSKYNGNLGERGCVAWLFEKKGVITLDAEEVNEEQVMDIVLEAGAEDMSKEDNILEVITNIEDFETVKEALEEKNIPYTLAQLSMVPQNTVSLEGKAAEQMLKLMDALEDNDDVQNVYANFDIPQEVMQEA